MQAWCEFAQHNNKYLAENYAMAHLQAGQREYFIPVRQSSYFVPFRHFTHRRVKAQTKMLSRGAWGLQDLARWRKCKRGACPALGYFGSLTNSNEHKFAFILKVYCKNKLKWVFIALKKIRSAITVYCILFQFQASQISIGHDLLLQVICKDSNVWWEQRGGDRKRGRGREMRIICQYKCPAITP